MQNLAVINVAVCACDRSQEFNSDNLHSDPSLVPLAVVPWAKSTPFQSCCKAQLSQYSSQGARGTQEMQVLEVHEESIPTPSGSNVERKGVKVKCWLKTTKKEG